MKVSDAIERIDGTMANSYFIMIDGMKIIVDAGTPGSGKKLWDTLKIIELNPTQY